MMVSLKVQPKADTKSGKF